MMQARLMPGLTRLRAEWIDGAPVAAVVFYRALVQSGQTAAIEALAAALKARGMNVLPVFVSVAERCGERGDCFDIV